MLIPIAAVEQHGPHLPLDTDSRLLEAIVSRAERQLGDQVIVTPLMWLGNSHHHLDFPGTLSAEPRLYIELLAGILNNWLHHGFRRLILINGHGGNDVPGKQAIYEIRQQFRRRLDPLLLLGTYWGLGSQPWLEMPTISQREMGHACEWETSMMLAIDADCVGDYRGLATVEFGNPFTPATRAWLTQERSKLGYIGSPQLANREKGEHLLENFTRDLVQIVRRVERWDGHSWNG